MPSPAKSPRKRRQSPPMISTAVGSLSGSSSPMSSADLVAAIAPNQDNVRKTSQGPYLHPTQHVSFMSHFTPPHGAPGYLANMNVNAGVARQAAPSAEDNVPNRFELFLLGDGEKKVAEEADTRIPSSSIFTFKKEDHTLGNMLRSRLLQSPHVSFAGYKVPHPLVSEFILRIQTDGTLTPRAALMQACQELINDLGILSREFTKEWELRKMVGDGAKADEKNGEKDKNAGR